MSYSKTIVIADLVQELSVPGMRVGTTKRTHARDELNSPGTVSHRHRQAGARMVGIVLPGMIALHWPDAHESTDRYDRVLALFADCDRVLVERMRRNLE